MNNDSFKQEAKPIVRYPGGKGRMLDFLVPHLSTQMTNKKRLVEPFVGGGAIFFALKPKRAYLTDINLELIDLYRGIRRHPLKVWEIFRSFPSSKRAYYRIRGWDHKGLDLASRAARTLYLNRTCFKGMWRHNLRGQFNVGYGGQDRRWVINEENLMQVSKRLRKTVLKCADFADVIDCSGQDDFIFMDPPYKPGYRHMVHHHYRNGKFTFDDHKRLAKALFAATARGVKWAMTTTSHKDVASLFNAYYIKSIPVGTGMRIGEMTENSGEVFISNY